MLPFLLSAITCLYSVAGTSAMGGFKVPAGLSASDILAVLDHIDLKSSAIRSITFVGSEDVEVQVNFFSNGSLVCHTETYSLKTDITNLPVIEKKVELKSTKKSCD